MFLVNVLVSQLYPKQEHKQWTNNQSREMQYMAWYARWDMQCICVLRKGKNDQGIKLSNQVCHWKDEMISFEIDIKITGKGCMVCKWQATQEWRKTAINSTKALRMHQETKLMHSNIATKHTTAIYTRCFTKHEHWAMAKSQQNNYKQAWQKCKRYQLHRLSENTNMSKTTSGSKWKY